jgi:hypothetical protein
MTQAFDTMYARFDKPVSDLLQGFRVWHVCIIKARCVDEHNRMPVLGMGGSDRSNSRRGGCLTVVNRVVAFIASSSNELCR